MIRAPLTALAAVLATALPVAAQQAAPADPAAAAQTAPAERVAGTYQLDPDHTQVLFTYDHMGFSRSTGMVRGITGSVTLDPATPEKSAVEASFPLSALMTVSADLDKHLSSKDFFNGAAPDTAITFKSTAVEPSGDKARVTGDLTLNGVTKPVTLDVTLRQMGESPMTKKPAAGFEATGTLKRSDFNLGAFAPAVSDEVQLTINAEAQKG